MRYLFWLISLVTFTYVLIRSFTVTITSDEVWTLNGFAETPLWKIVTSKSPAANNHILNTILTKVCARFSTSEFSLRLPNIHALILNQNSCYKITGLLSKNRFIQLAFF